MQNQIGAASVRFIALEFSGAEIPALSSLSGAYGVFSPAVPSIDP
jgi:hypothetical protein